ncbi:hypothetical protein FVE85_9489 [Porphyridium purpureum]|uniref:OTU domain-containing protein n=1 Tax=Porphyridium purpureum TaxID=35688 RepID=A0A5J4YKA4_PORPP|nr:hypothetical protein FVE85_9489 [Porphyridium purpureum]|eukprot:POR4190..scf261_15
MRCEVERAGSELECRYHSSLVGKETPHTKMAIGAALVRTFSGPRRTEPKTRLKPAGSMNKQIQKRDALVVEYNKRLEENDFVESPAVRVETQVQDAFGETTTVLFHPIPADGNCGFEAIAMGMNIANTGKSGKGMSSRTVRAKLREELTQFRHFYELEAQRNAGFAVVVAMHSIDEVCESVGRRGKNGFWLGSLWGNMELLAIARALQCTIEVYQFDTSASKFRCYDAFEYGKPVIRLLYSGFSMGGHFDLFSVIRTCRTSKYLMCALQKTNTQTSPRSSRLPSHSVLHSLDVRRERRPLFPLGHKQIRRSGDFVCPACPRTLVDSQSIALIARMAGGDGRMMWPFVRSRQYEALGILGSAVCDA